MAKWRRREGQKSFARRSLHSSVNVSSAFGSPSSYRSRLNAARQLFFEGNRFPENVRRSARFEFARGYRTNLVRHVRPGKLTKSQLQDISGYGRVSAPVGYSESSSDGVTDRVGMRRSVCEQRKVRKEVLHALGRTGSGNARPEYTAKSRVRCG